jgi:hypothetical protein
MSSCTVVLLALCHITIFKINLEVASSSVSFSNGKNQKQMKMNRSSRMLKAMASPTFGALSNQDIVDNLWADVTDSRTDHRTEFVKKGGSLDFQVLSSNY